MEVCILVAVEVTGAPIRSRRCPAPGRRARFGYILDYNLHVASVTALWADSELV